MSAQQYICVDNHIVNTATKWIISYQLSDGSFRDPGRVLNTAMQGGSSRGPALTAYVITALCRVELSVSKMNDLYIYLQRMNDL